MVGHLYRSDSGVSIFIESDSIEGVIDRIREIACVTGYGTEEEIEDQINKRLAFGELLMSKRNTPQGETLFIASDNTYSIRTDLLIIDREQDRRVSRLQLKKMFS